MARPSETGSCPTGQAQGLGASRCDPARERTAENGYGCDDPNDPITRAQFESAPGYFVPDQSDDDVMNAMLERDAWADIEARWANQEQPQ